MEQPAAILSAREPSGSATARRTLAMAGAAHALHDGYTDLIYVLLPIWQAEFGLDYGMLAALRGIYAGMMAAFQLPAGWLAERLDGRVVLAIGTALAALGYALAGFTGSLVGLCDLGRRIEHAAPHRLRGGVARLWIRVARPAGDL
jgi:MFS family permease